MNVQEVRTLYDQWMRLYADFAGMQRVEALPVVRYVNQLVPRSMIRYSDVTATNADDIIRQEVDYFESIGHQFEWTVYDYDQPDDLQNRLENQGFTIGDTEAILVLDIMSLPEERRQAHSYDIREVTDPETVRLILNTVQNVVFDTEPDGATTQHIVKTISQNPNHYQMFAAYVDEKPVSAAWTEYHVDGNPFAGLYGGATLETHRGKGIYSALVAKRAHAAAQRGVRYLTVDASPMSNPILKRNRFIQIARSWACNYTTHENKDA